MRLKFSFVFLSPHKRGELSGIAVELNKSIGYHKQFFLITTESCGTI